MTTLASTLKLEDIISTRSDYGFNSSSTSHRLVIGNRPSDFGMQLETVGFPNGKRSCDDIELRIQEKSSGGRRNARKERAPIVDWKTERFHELRTPSSKLLT